MDKPNDQGIPPYRDVKVGVSNLEYVQVCDVFGGGPVYLEAWKELGNLLAHRVGWHFELVNWGEPMWSLGSFGESMMNIQISERGFECYEYRSGQSFSFKDIAEVTTWVDAQEFDARQLSELSIEWLSADDWQLLKRYQFEARVSTIGDSYIVEVDGVLGDSRLCQRFADAVQSAGKVIVDFLNAPSALAPSINVALTCDPSAVALFLRQEGNS